MKVLSKPQSQLREDCHQWTKIIWRENLLRFMALQRESIIATFFLLRINRIWYMNGIWPWHYSGFLSRICCFEWIVLLTIYILIYQRYWGVLLLGLVVFKSRFCAYSCRLITKICEWDEYHEFAFYVCNLWANDTNTYIQGVLA